MTENIDPVFEDVCCEEKRKVDPELLESVLILAIEIAREGREGRRIGTIFVIGDSENVLANSRPLILDPLFGHPDEKKQLDDPNVKETIKELAQLDGAFVISGTGTVLSAARYINVTATNTNIPLGLGSRHMAGASITKVTNAVAVVVSESSVVRVIDDGEVVSEVIPELWLMQRYGLTLRGDLSTKSNQDLMVVTKTDS